MKNRMLSLLSTLGIPVAGLGLLLIGTQTPRVSLQAQAAEAGEATFLLAPDSRVDGVMATLLRQEARRVARAPAREKRHAADGYNLVAAECTPEVFQKTGLPPRL